jgi:3-hydroxyisobutyrate dehydrogenase
MHVGVAGLGKMGAAIALRLIETDNQVTVWNRTPERTAPIVAAGAAAAASPAALASAVDAVITILTDAAAIHEVYSGPAGLLAGAVAGKLFIEMSTVRPEVEVALAAKARAVGAAFVECPVGGTTGPARQGKLIGLVGAEEGDAARARPLIEQLCRRIEFCGPVGTGSVMKLTINLPLLVYWQALGEALALCRPLGIEPARLIDLLADTSGGPNVLKVRGPAVAKMLKGEDAGPVTFSLDTSAKDLRTMLAEAAERGIDMPVVRETLACYEEASRNGLGDGEVSALPVYWQSRKPGGGR